MSKPKEFYVKPTRERNGLKSYTATVAPINVAGEIRVIEYSVYQDLERKLEIAREALEFYAKPEVWGTASPGERVSIDPVDWQQMDFEKNWLDLRGGKRAREALKELEDK